MRGLWCLTVADFVLAVEGEKNFDVRFPDLWDAAMLHHVAAEINAEFDDCQESEGATRWL